MVVSGIIGLAAGSIVGGIVGYLGKCSGNG
jgi:hypothetical protein